MIIIDVHEFIGVYLNYLFVSMLSNCINIWHFWRCTFNTKMTFAIIMKEIPSQIHYRISQFSISIHKKHWSSSSSSRSNIAIPWRIGKDTGWAYHGASRSLSSTNPLLTLLLPHNIYDIKFIVHMFITYCSQGAKICWYKGNVSNRYT